MGVPRPTRLQSAFLLVTALSVLLMCGMGHMRSGLVPSLNSSGSGADRGSRFAWEPVVHTGALIRTNSCFLPQFDPFDPSTRPFYWRRSGKCPGNPNFLTVKCTGLPSSPPAQRLSPTAGFDQRPLSPCEGGKSYRFARNGFPVIIEEKLKEHDVPVKDVVCFYEEIYRNDSLEAPDKSYTVGERKPLVFDKPLTEEFLRVECATKKFRERPFHSQFLLNPVIKKHVEERCRKARLQTPYNLSVLVLGLDSVSHLNVDRHLPDTARFLREELGAFELHGYTKVGKNSFPNQIPLITGLKGPEAAKFAPDHFFDNLSARMIWNRYKKRGYRTMFLEDYAYFGLFTYSYDGRGFRGTPADYYPRPVVMAMERSSRKMTSHWDAPQCLGPTMPFEESLDYIARFTQVMDYRPFFAFSFIAEITHDFPNNAGYADQVYRNLLQMLHASGALNRTVLVFLSDHGARFGGSRNTYIGKFEDRLPFAFLGFPAWFLRAHPDAERSLRANQRRLTTPFDVHATLVELLDYPRVMRPTTMYGLSLLHEVPEGRTCADASIQAQYCACNPRPDVAVPAALAASLGDQLVSSLNYMAGSSPWCHLFKLLEVLSVVPFQTDDALTTKYWVSVKVSPGECVFEGSIVWNGRYMTESPEISRNTLYAPNAYCMSGIWWMKEYCHCRRTFGDFM